MAIIDPFKTQEPKQDAQSVTPEKQSNIVDPFKSNQYDIDKRFPKEEQPSFMEKAGAFGYGATTGLLGGAGELEQLGLKGISAADRYFGVPTPEQQKTFFPTVEDIKQGGEKYLGIKRPREAVRGYETTGEIVGGLGTSLPGIFKHLVGSTTKTAEEIAKKAESLGFKLSPAQVRADVPVAQKGATGFAQHNQELANKLASEGTGETVREISPNFIRTRFEKLGKEFDNIYKDKIFNIDEQAVNAIQEINRIESQLPGVAASSPVKQATDTILSGFQRLMGGPGAQANTFAIDGNALQRLRNALTARARASSDQQAHEIYNLVDEIDKSVARHQPQIAEQLNILRPKYRNTIILDDLYRAGGIKGGNISLQRLGNIIMQRPERIDNPANIDQLGQMGKELNMKARWETEGEGATSAESMLKGAVHYLTGGLSTGLGLRSRLARAVQRAQATPTGQAVTQASEKTIPIAVGAATEPVTRDRQ